MIRRRRAYSFQASEPMAGIAKTLPAISRWARRGAGAVLVAAVFAMCAQAQEAPERNAAALAQKPPPATPQQKTSLTGNPLWRIALGALEETRARPIFSPSRRPPSPPVVAAVPPPPPPRPPPASEPDHLKLTLMGTVIGEADRIGVFVDEASKEVIRIRIGESHGGWTLRSVHRRAANFEKDDQEASLLLPTPGAEQPAPVTGGAASKIGVTLSTGGAGVCGNGRGAGGSPENCARSAAPVIPASAPATRRAREIRQDILSIAVQH
jgi:general secretion pathway protein N